MIIYTWRILEGKVPNITSADGSSNKIMAKIHSRRGRECSVPKTNRRSPLVVQRLQQASLVTHGQMLFNSLPREIRNITCCKVEAFKTALDRYLRLVPDEPQIPGYTAQRRAESNSLLDMIPHARPSNSLLDTIPHARPQVEAPDDSDERGCVPNIAGVP